jgi:hypothetical protein
MTVLRPNPEALAATSRTASRLDLAFQPNGEFRGVLQNASPIHPARTFWRTGDDGVELFGIERAVNHQRLGDSEHRRAMLLDQRFGFGEAKRQIGIDSGFTGADHQCDFPGLANVAMRDPWRARRCAATINMAG